MIILIRAFNLDVKGALTIPGPADSYFGFSSAILKNKM